LCLSALIAGIYVPSLKVIKIKEYYYHLLIHQNGKQKQKYETKTKRIVTFARAILLEKAQTLRLGPGVTMLDLTAHR